MEIKKKIKLYLLKRKIKSLERDLRFVSLHLHFDGWTGKNCIKETNYLVQEIDKLKRTL
jgi:hypothetical protein